MPTPELMLLAVDDQPDNLISLRALLEDALPAARLLTATSGPKAIELALVENPDVILLDVVMPEMDGFEVCRRLKADARTRDIPVVFLTALRADREHRIRALEEGAEAFLSKPIDEIELVAQVRAMAKIKAAANLKRDQTKGLEAMVAERTREIEQGRVAALNLLEDLRAEQEERKRADEALRESEEKYRTLVESSSDLIWQLKQDGSLAYVSPSWKTNLGYEPSSLTGAAFQPLVHPDDLAVCESYMTETIEAGRPLPGRQYRVRHADGAWRWHEGSVTPVFGNDGSFVHFAGISRDITDRKQAEEAVRREQIFSKAIIDSIPGAFYVLDERGRYAGWNAYQRDEVIGKPEEQVAGFSALETIHPEDRDRVQERIVNVLKNGAVETMAGRVLLHGGPAFRWFLMTGRRLTINDRPFLVGIGFDITERKQAEEAVREFGEYLDRIINAIGDPVFVKDDQFRFTLVNDALCALLGRPREEILGKTGLEFLPSDQMDHFLEVDRKVLSSGVEDLCKELLTAYDGRVHTIVTKKTCYVDGQGARFIVGAIRDVTRQESLEEQLRMSQKMEAIGSLAGGVAHDFNNLLSVILGNTAFAMEALRETDPIRSDLLEVKQAAESAAALTRQLLAFSRRQILQPVPLSLNRIAAGIEKMLRRIVGEDLDYVQVLAPDLGMVRADPGQIEQVLMNLVVNARDAMPAGGKLTIETQNVEIDEEHAARHVAVTPGAYVLLAVTDTGCGMDEQTKARVFEPFFTTKRPGKGTGLGLSTAYGIVKQSGGSIWVDSEPGKGTTFKIYLPRDLGTKATVPPRVVTRATGTETVLVVEDEEALRKVVRRSLTAAGFTVLTAADGVAALEIAARHTGDIQLLLSDVIMPKMSGRALALEFLKTRPAIKVLYMSGYTDNAIVHHGVLDEGTQFIGKPFTGAELARKVREVLDGNTSSET